MTKPTPTSSIFSIRRDKPWLEATLLAAALLLCCLSLALGVVSIPLPELWRSLFSHTASTTIENIVLYYRLPRTIACITAGAGLSVSGLMLQAVLNNSLASPGIIGVNAGAGFAVVLAAALFPGVFAARSLAALIGALLVCLTVYLIARRAGSSRTTLILAGVAVSSMFTAGIDALVTVYPETLTDKTIFYIGGFSNVDLPCLRIGVPMVLLSLILIRLLAGNVNVLILGDEVAGSLGLPVERCRFLAILFAAALAAGAVSIAGLLGFVGLIVPHITRRLLGNDHRRLVLATALAGVDLTLLCDLIARLAFAPYELPVGVLLSFLGAPFFIWLLLHKRRRCYD